MASLSQSISNDLCSKSCCTLRENQHESIESIEKKIQKNGLNQVLLNFKFNWFKPEINLNLFNNINGDILFIGKKLNLLNLFNNKINNKYYKMTKTLSPGRDVTHSGELLSRINFLNPQESQTHSPSARSSAQL